MSKSRWDQTGLATAIGLMAPICWGMSVGLVRGIAEGFGMAQGQFLMYCIAVTFLFFLVGLPDFRTMNRKYLYFGIPTATASGLTFVLAIFTSSGGAQTLEVGMVNYLWPSLTILFAVLFNGVRARWWLWLGVTVAIVGIMRILGGDAGLSWNGFCERFTQNPISYVLALAAAVTWAGFSSMTKAWGAGHNPSTVIFLIDTTIYGLFWLLGIGTGTGDGVDIYGIVSVVGGGVALGAAYACWAHGMQRGNITLLATASYFTPALSCLFGVFWIGAELSSTFWGGVALVISGSILCWSATAKRFQRVTR